MKIGEGRDRSRTRTASSASSPEPRCISISAALRRLFQDAPDRILGWPVAEGSWSVGRYRQLALLISRRDGECRRVSFSDAPRERLISWHPSPASRHDNNYKLCCVICGIFANPADAADLIREDI